MNEDVDYDPWDDAPDEIDPAEIREMLYESGIKSFPLDVLEKMWLRELRDVGLSKVEAPTGIPPKAESQQVDRTIPPLEGGASGALGREPQRCLDRVRRTED